MRTRARRTRSPAGRRLASPGGGTSAAAVAGPDTLANLYAWYKGDAGRYDATSGGSPVTADRGAVARWEDQSGNARHLTQATSGSRPVYDALKGLVTCELNAFQCFSAPASFQLATQGFSLFLVCEANTLRRSIVSGALQQFHLVTRCNGTNFLNVHYEGDASSANQGKLACYDGTSFKVSTVRPLTTTRCLVGFVGSAAGFKCWLDDANNSAAALASNTATVTEFLGNTADGASNLAVRDLIVFSRALSDGEVTGTVLPYARSRGVASSRAKQVVFEGDSITAGNGSTVNRSWPSQLTGVAGAVRRRVTAEPSITLATLSAQAAAHADPLLAGGETNVLCAYATSNDIAAGTSSGTAISNYWTYTDARRAAGWKVVAFTMLPRTDVSGAKETARGAFNTELRTNWASHADALADVAADSRLQTITDATYFDADQVHPTTAGYAVIAGIAEPQILNLLG